MLENSAVGTKFRIGGGGGRFPLRYGVRAERSGLKIFPVGGRGPVKELSRVLGSLSIPSPIFADPNLADTEIRKEGADPVRFEIPCRSFTDRFCCRLSLISRGCRASA